MAPDPSPPLLGAKRIILKRLNAELTDEQLESITTAQEADELIKFYQSEKTNKAPILVQSKGIPNLDNKPPEERKENQAPPSDDPYTKEELNDPLQIDAARCNKCDPESRIMKLYSAEFPNGRVV